MLRSVIAKTTAISYGGLDVEGDSGRFGTMRWQLVVFAVLGNTVLKMVTPALLPSGKLMVDGGFGAAGHGYWWVSLGGCEVWLELGLYGPYLVESL